MVRTPALPDGTQVVLREAALERAGGRVPGGATGRTVGRDGDGRYLVRLTDGRTVACCRDQRSLRRAFQQDVAIGGTDEAQGNRLVTEHTIYAAVVGSRAFGLAMEDSDTDVRGVYVAPTDSFWSLVKPPPHVDGPGPQTFSWEVERFCELALKANPNLLEVLHSPLVLTRTPLGEELLALRSVFLSQLAYQTYSGYVLSQFQEARGRSSPAWAAAVEARHAPAAVAHLRAGPAAARSHRPRCRRAPGTAARGPGRPGRMGRGRGVAHDPARRSRRGTRAHAAPSGTRHGRGQRLAVLGPGPLGPAGHRDYRGGVMTRDMTQLDLAELRAVVEDEPYPLVFATVSGAHLYASRDSDVDLRGAHVLPAAEVVGLRHGPQTLDRMWTRDGAEIDLVTHDLAKFCRLLLQRNGYVLEQLLSPLVVTSGDVHAELVSHAPACLTRHHAHHYRGFANSQQRLYTGTGELKPLLYTFRVLLTGIALMRAGRLQAHLPTLLEDVPQAPTYLSTLMLAKASGEHARLTSVPDAPEPELIEADLARLHAVLDETAADSTLPDHPTAEPALHDLIVRTRLAP